MQNLFSNITFAPLLPIYVYYALVILSILLSVFYIVGKQRSWFLRSGLILIICTALLNPIWKNETQVPQDNIVFLIKDTSKSQNLANRKKQTQKISDVIEKKFSNIDRLLLKTIIVETQDSKGTPLLSALKHASQSVPHDQISGAIIIGDGQFHDHTALDDFPAPVHFIQTGNKTEWDQKITLLNTPKFALLNKEFHINLRIDNFGAVPEKHLNSIPINMLIDGHTHKTGTFNTNQIISIPVTIDHAGHIIIEINMPKRKGELTHRNNTLVLEINIIRERLRVLMVSGMPHAGERVWRNLLKSDGMVDLIHFTILRTSQNENTVPNDELSLVAFPVKKLFEEQLNEFDLIIFDRYKRRGFLTDQYLQNIIEYTENGGALLISAGSEFAGADSLHHTPLKTILPTQPTTRVIERAYIPKISPLGIRHPITQNLTQDFTIKKHKTWGRWLRLIDTNILQGQIIMTGIANKPLIVLNRVENGRIAMILSDHIWLWSRNFEKGGPYQELLRNLAHWLMQEPQLEEEQLSANLIENILHIERRSLQDNIKNLQITSPNGKTDNITLTPTAPGRWTTSYKTSETGLYKLQMGDLYRLVSVGMTIPTEYKNVIATNSLINPLITKTGGGIFFDDQIENLNIRIVPSNTNAHGHKWLGIYDRQAYLNVGIHHEPILPIWVYLLISLLWAGFMWWYEGRKDVV